MEASAGRTRPGRVEIQATEAARLSDKYGAKGETGRDIAERSAISRICDGLMDLGTDSGSD